MSLETMTKLQTVTVGAGGSNSVTFSSIPQGYTDLKVVMSARTTGSNGGRDYCVFRLNSNTSSNYLRKWMYAYDGDTTGSGSNSTELTGNTIVLPDAAVSTFFSANEITFYNYSKNTQKIISSDSNASATSNLSYILSMSATTWNNSAPITSITFYAALNGDTANLTGVFAQNSTFTLYGIKNSEQTAGNSIKATGGNIVFDGTYVYHVFSASGAFVPTQSLTADALVVAGGGGGGSRSGFYGGGGGAGGLLGFANQSFFSGVTYACTVGAGGSGGGSGGANGTVGGDSQLGSLTLVKGGGYGSGTAAVGGSGGSGGGGSRGYAGGSPTTNQGYAGGSASVASAGGGGGGGAGAAGDDVATDPNPGGVGSSAYSAWGAATGQGQNISGTYYFAGGGGGVATAAATSSGGYGGGGTGAAWNGGSPIAGSIGTPNTGGGGGGGASGVAAYAGGSGIVIIRYKG